MGSLDGLGVGGFAEFVTQRLTLAYQGQRELVTARIVQLLDAGRYRQQRVDRAPAPEVHHLMHAARADLLRRLGRDEEARAAYERALELGPAEPERRFLQRRLEAL